MFSLELREPHLKKKKKMARKEDTVPVPDLKRLIVNSLRRAKVFPGIQGYHAHPKQVAFHESKKKGKMMMGGNRVGKTVGGGTETVMRLTGIHEFLDMDGNVHRIEGIPKPPVKGRGVSVDNDRGLKLIMLPEIKRWMPSKFLINNSWEDSYSKTDKILTLTNESTMEFMSYEQDVDKFGGTSRHFIWFDEEPPQDIFEECLTRLIDTDGDWYITMTPLQEMSWTYNTLYLPGLNKKIDIDIIAADTYENPHIKQEAFERLTLTMSDESKATRRTGTYISHTGLIYGESFKREKNVCPDLVQSDRFQILKDDWSHFQMMDHGYTNYTAILFAAYNEDGKIIIYDEIYEHKKIVRDLAQLWRERREALGISTKYSVGDPAIRSKDPIKGSSVQSEYGENGIYIALGNNDVQSGITLVQRMFREQQLIITTRCEKLLDELSQYRWDRHLTKARDRKNTKETPVKKNDHAMDALRYGIMSRPRRFNDIPTREVPVGMHVVRAATNYDWELVNQTDQHIDEFLGSEV